MDATFWMIAFMTLGYFLVWTIHLKINYFISYGICLDYHSSPFPFVSYPTYEYEVDEDGIIVKYVNRGRSMLEFGKGKQHRILINKNDHNKVVGYRELVAYIILLIILVVSMAIRIIHF